METEASRKVVIDYLAAQAAGDRKRLTELLDENVRWCPPGDVAGIGKPQGRENVLSALAEAGARFFDLGTMRVDVQWMIAEGNKVVVRTQNQVVASNGRDYRNEYVWVYTCANGKIVDMEEHTDTQLFKQVVLD